MAGRGILELDRADPLAARLDHVLGPVAQRDIAVGIDDRHIPGDEVALGVERLAALEVTGCDPGRFHPKMAERLAIRRQRLSRVIDDARRDAAGDAAGLHAQIDARVEIVHVAAGLRRRHCRHQRLGHAPGLDVADAVVPIQTFDHAARRRRAAGKRHPQGREALAAAPEPIEQDQPEARHAGGDGHALTLDEFVELLRFVVAPGQHELGAGVAGRERHVPGIAVEQRRHRHHHFEHAVAVIGEEPEGTAHEGLQDQRPVRIDDALGVAGRAGGVADRRRTALVERGPGEIPLILGGDQCFVAMDVRQLRFRHVAGVGHDDVADDTGEARRDRLGDRQRQPVDEQPAILGMIDDVDELFGEQPGIDRVQHGAAARRGVEHLEVSVGVPSQRRDRRALADTEAVQRLRHALRPPMHLGIVAAMDAPVELARDHLRRAVVAPGMLDEHGQQQRHVHHQALHRHCPPASLVPVQVIGLAARATYLRSARAVPARADRRYVALES